MPHPLFVFDYRLHEFQPVSEMRLSSVISKKWDLDQQSRERLKRE